MVETELAPLTKNLTKNGASSTKNGASSTKNGASSVATIKNYFYEKNNLTHLILHFRNA